MAAVAPPDPVPIHLTELPTTGLPSPEGGPRHPPRAGPLLAATRLIAAAAQPTAMQVLPTRQYALNVKSARIRATSSVLLPTSGRHSTTNRRRGRHPRRSRCPPARFGAKAKWYTGTVLEAPVWSLCRRLL
jgi:hypothetical protein